MRPGEELQALSIWQPAASLIVAGFKRYDLHTWMAPPELHFQTIAIHAASRLPPKPEITRLLYQMQRDGGQGILLASLAAEEIDAAINMVRRARYLPRGQFIGTVKLGKPVRNALPFVPYPETGKRQVGHWAWPMLDATARDRFAAKGTGGFFTMTVPETWHD